MITTAQIEEAFGYPLLTEAQHQFMTNSLRHHLLTPWYHATKTDDTKKQIWDAINPFGDKVFYHACLFEYTIERVQNVMSEGVCLEPREDSPRAYGEEALLIFIERVNKRISNQYLYEWPVRLARRMTLEDTNTLLKVVRIANYFDLHMCVTFDSFYIDKDLRALPDVVRKQIAFLKTLESEKENG